MFPAGILVAIILRVKQKYRTIQEMQFCLKTCRTNTVGTV
jgi:hypothetical protein